ncbi:MAG: hypothetical protein WD850_01900 [Candidatus Spechtbacterales bacterium]
MNNLRARLRGEEGLSALLITFAVLILGLILTVSVAAVYINRLAASRTMGLSEQAYFAAEAGVEDALLRRLDTGKQLPASPYALSVGGATATTTVTEDIGITTISVDGNASNRIRNIEVVLVVNTNTDEESFFYGLQIGSGGLEMDNNSVVEGSVYSNGSIEGDSGAQITGDAFVAGGSTSDNEIDDVEIGGSAHAPSLDDCSVGADIFYIVSNNCSAGGSITQQSEPIEEEPLPISDAIIDAWKEYAEDGGIISSGNFSPPGDSTTTIGPGVIEGSMILTNGQKVILEGTVYVKGNIDLGNGASVKLAASYESHSGVIITDGWIHARNNGVFQGSGEAGSYLMFLTTSSCDGTSSSGCTHHNAAIDLHNNAEGAIFYAGNGFVNLHNNVSVIQLTAHKVFLDNNAVIQYEIGLASAVFSQGPGGTNEIKSWKER